MTAGYTLTESFLYHQSPGFVSQLLPIDKLPGQPGRHDHAGRRRRPARGHYRQPGLPEHLINLLATYKINFGLGATVDLVVTGPIHDDYTGEPEDSLAVTWTTDGILYLEERGDARLVPNLTDQDNWAPPNPVYGDGSILRDLPFRIEGGVKIRF